MTDISSRPHHSPAGPRPAPNAASSRSASCAAGARPASPICSASCPRPCTAPCPASAWPACPPGSGHRPEHTPLRTRPARRTRARRHQETRQHPRRRRTQGARPPSGPQEPLGCWLQLHSHPKTHSVSVRHRRLVGRCRRRRTCTHDFDNEPVWASHIRFAWNRTLRPSPTDSFVSANQQIRVQMCPVQRLQRHGCLGRCALVTVTRSVATRKTLVVRLIPQFGFSKPIPD